MMCPTMPGRGAIDASRASSSSSGRAETDRTISIDGPIAGDDDRRVNPYPATLQQGMRKYRGQLFVAPSALYFVCAGSSSALWGAVGQQVGGLIGGAISAVGGGGYGQGPGGPVNEQQLHWAVTQAPGSLILVPQEIQELKYTIWWRFIRWRGSKLGLPDGLPKPLRLELGQWANYYQIPTKGGSFFR